CDTTVDVLSTVIQTTECDTTVDVLSTVIQTTECDTTVDVLSTVIQTTECDTTVDVLSTVIQTTECDTTVNVLSTSTQITDCTTAYLNTDENQICESCSSTVYIYSTITVTVDTPSQDGIPTTSEVNTYYSSQVTSCC
ncbi:hypothetical protein BB560_004373, partial [Smittium megazygosporum]